MRHGHQRAIVSAVNGAGWTLLPATVLARGIRSHAFGARNLALTVVLLCSPVPCRLNAQILTAQVARTPSQPASAVQEQLIEGERAVVARQPRVALDHFEQALQIDPRNYEALWKSAAAEIDLGEAEQDEKKREALYLKATEHARKSVEVFPEGAEGYFSVSHALGRKALTVGARERVKYGTEVRANALKALELNPKHAGAMHIMAVWNAEIMRLNGLTRLIARTLLGGQVLSTASWAAAVKYIEESIALDPERAVHRLDQARIYRDLGRKTDARAAYEAVLKCALIDANDEIYQRSAAAELRAMK